jgi:hypothetical protein
LRLVAGVAIKMIAKYPVLEHTAFILIGYVGLLLLSELHFHDYFEAMGPLKVKILKFAGIIVITATTIAWSRFEPMQKILNPLLKVFLFPMNLVAALIGSVIFVITWPFRWIWMSVRN